MSYTDKIDITPLKKGQKPAVTITQAKASLERGRAELSKTVGFELPSDDPRVAVRSSWREGNAAFVTYGAPGRRLDASALAYELNN